jgi:ABC-type transporter Mla subunit MlaD
MIAGVLGMSAVLTASLAVCRGHRDADIRSVRSSAESGPADRPAPKACPAGNAIKDGACLVVVTPQKIAVVAQQVTRIDDLARRLDQVDTIGAPIRLFAGIRQLDPWRALEKTSGKVAALDAVADALDRAVKILRAFHDSLGETSARLGNLQGELDRVMADAGDARRLEEVRAQISTQVRAAIEPFAAQVQDAIQNAIVPLTAELSELSAAVLVGCATLRLPSGDKAKDPCAQASDSFGKALAYLAEVKARPAALFDDVTSQLETELDPLIDAGSRTLLDAARARIDGALRPSPPGAGAGSGAGSGSAT